MDFDPKHDQALDLPLRFPDDPVDEPPPPLQPQPASTSMRRQKSQDPQQPSPAQKQAAQSPARSPALPEQPPPQYTVYIRVPAPRNGFVDPPDVDWNKDKDDALWRILSRASKNDINWEELAQTFDATVDFLLVQATVLTERHVSQVRAQTRKVATLSTANPNTAAGRDSPVNSPSLTSEAMGRTLSSGGAGAGAGAGPSGSGAGARTASAETMRRTASAGSRAGPGPGPRTPGAVGGSSGSRRPSMEDSQIRPSRSIRPTLQTISSFSPQTAAAAAGAAGGSVASPVGRGLSLRPAQPMDAAGGRPGSYDFEGEDEGEGEGEAFAPSSPAATSDSSSSSSSTPSEPVMSRIFRRPPGHVPQQQQQTRDRGSKSHAAGDGDFGVIGLGISSGGSDDGDADADGDGDESETQAAFLRYKASSKASSTATHPTGTGSGSRPHPRHQHHQHHQKRHSTADSASPSSSASASPTTKAFKTPTVAAAAAAAATAVLGSSSTASASASAKAAARLQSSRVPGIRSPPRLQHTLSARSPAVRAARAASGISREGSEIGTTPSIGSSFSDLDDVSFTQSVLDEALASKVEDTVVTPNPNNNNSDPMASSATRRQR
ncbi:uncharacterized protein SPSK_06048 [Sporothrix schenckii 1099-18]|uniref:Autophagy-related protein 29 n=1 Tax=Sporothrix schenckii 1099-18 TaxID=1397361 RepID=A0A0F2MKN1_SPOSC|nr:uncharacterized protein SPSK_06048 [Sporothrix schenckii 1099-18]KJR89614.1 hypothetical protein SPSK_06048 [Sporothrix schenckii 1099-18]